MSNAMNLSRNKHTILLYQNNFNLDSPLRNVSIKDLKKNNSVSMLLLMVLTHLIYQIFLLKLRIMKKALEREICLLWT